MTGCKELSEKFLSEYESVPEEKLNGLTRQQATSYEFGKTVGYGHVIELLKNNEIEPEWIPVTTRPLDEEEKAYYSGIYGEDSITGIFDCGLPDCESYVLVTTKYGVTTTNYDPEYGFEDYDAEEILAWMPLPRPYKMEEE